MRRWILPTATISLGVLGAGALVSAALMPAATDPPPEGLPEGAPAAVVLPEPVATEDQEYVAPLALRPAASTPIAELPDPGWVAQVAAATEIPERALAAYAGASLALAESHGTCGLGWNTLAAIGAVESEHGSMQDAVIGPDGVVSPPIVGVALDGSEGVASIPDTDGGLLDGDDTWDRAVGPMQFIPTTWEQYAADGNRDGTADIHQIDDAVLAAAHYLCDVGGDLREDSGWIQAVTAYNPDVDYNNQVAELANRYAEITG